uniref:Very low-density lipoprotein receptor n=1 Tax=Knipowitschia caucasica TaxID=637954 RepID=A0AAV2KWL1_KNICA
METRSVLFLGWESDIGDSHSDPESGRGCCCLSLKNGSDVEAGPTNQDDDERVCKSGEFFCDDGHCVSVLFLCDGTDHCSDGSDERSCPNCTSGFRCAASGWCLSQQQLCDGQSDCEDARDEDPLLCASQTTPCAASELQCRDGRCIHHSYKCDNTNDCSDGSDEEDCDVNECLLNNGGCPSVCVCFHCECPNNTRQRGDGHCEEMNPCLEADVCDQLCSYSEDHLSCRCQEDYEEDHQEDHQEGTAAGACRAKGDAAQLFFADLEGVHFADITDFVPKTLQSSHGRRHMTVLSSNNTVFLAQPGSTSIYRLLFDGVRHEAQLLLKAAGPVHGLAVDWTRGLLLWSSADSGSLHLSVIDGSVQRVLWTGLDSPRAVAVHPERGVIFWAECGKNPKIQRSTLDGQNRTTLVNTLIHKPVALSLDLPRDLLYWADQGLRRISRVNLEGHYRKTVVESNGFLDRPFGLALFERFVYWSDEASGSICRANKHHGRHFEVLLKDITSPGSVVIAHSALQPNRNSGLTTCAVDALTLNISCSENGFPPVSRTLPASSLSDSTFAALLALTMVLIVLLLGLCLWWCREELRPLTSNDHSLTLKESRDPLLRDANIDLNLCPTKETPVRLHLEADWRSSTDGQTISPTPPSLLLLAAPL